MAPTSLQIARAFPHAHPDSVSALASNLPDVVKKYDISIGNRLAMFLAQTCFESEYFTQVVENIDYRWQQLRLLFPSHFPTDDVAKQYGGKPEAIANRIYALRNGNGDEASGDGWTYRGHGYIQITGKRNHDLLARDLGIPFTDIVAYLQTPKGALWSAGWFWNQRALNRFADQKDVAEVTRLINGGHNGLSDRQKLFEQAQKVFA